MTTPTQTPVTVDVPWLRSNPAEIIGKPRPRTFADLLTGLPLYRRVYQEWLSEPGNQAVAAPGLRGPEVTAAYKYLTDPSRDAGDAVHKAHAAQFAAEGYQRFYADVGRIKDQVRAQAKKHAGGGVTEEQAITAVGREMAAASVKRKVAEQAAQAGGAGGDGGGIVRAWLQVESYKKQHHAAFMTAVAAFRDPNWGQTGERDEAFTILAASHAELSSKEAVLREAVLRVQSTDPKAVATMGLEDTVFEALTDWSTALNGTADALASAGELVVAWAERNAAQVTTDNFDAHFAVLGGCFFAARTAVGAAGAVMAFFPQLAPVATGLSLADTALEFALKKVVVALNAKLNDKDKIELAAKDYQLPDDFYDKKLGKVYKAREDIKNAVDDVTAAAKRKAREYASGAVAFVRDQPRKTFPNLSEENLAAFETLLTRLEVKIKTSKEESWDAKQAKADADAIEEMVGQLAELCGVELKTLSDLLTDFLKDAFARAAPALAEAFAKAAPVFGVVVFAATTANDALTFYADIHKKLVNKEGLTDVDVLRVQALVRNSIVKQGPIVHTLDLEAVTITGSDGATTFQVTIGGVAGTFDQQTLRFSPTDRAAMTAAVKAATQREHPGGFELHGSIFEVTDDWASLTLTEQGAGDFGATVMTRRTAIGNVPLTPDDGRDWQLRLWVDASGGAALLDTGLLQGGKIVESGAAKQHPLVRMHAKVGHDLESAIAGRGKDALVTVLHGQKLGGALQMRPKQPKQRNYGFSLTFGKTA